MAVSGNVYSGLKAKWGWSQETTFGTALADSTNYILAESSTMVWPSDWGKTSDITPKLRGQLYPDKADEYTTLDGGTVILPFSDMIVRRLDLAELLYAVTQTVSEAATSPYQKDFEIGSSTTFPDFSSNAGYFATLFLELPISNKDVKLTSAILQSLTLSADLVGGDGRLMASGEWITGFNPSTSANFSGTPASNTQNYYNFGQPATKQINSNDIVLYSFEITITNNAVRIGNDSSGEAENYGTQDGYSVTGSIVTKYDANTAGLLSDSLTGTQRSLQLNVGSSGNAGYFDILVDNAHFEPAEQDFAYEKGQAVTLNFTALGDTSTNPLVDIQVDDGTDQSW